jgi:transketolase
VEKTIRLEPFVEKFQAFGWGALGVDGHDVGELRRTFDQLPLQAGKPSAVIAKTVKGKGVPFMEGKVLWHYRPPTDEELGRALDELDTEPPSDAEAARAVEELQRQR